MLLRDIVCGLTMFFFFFFFQAEDGIRDKLVTGVQTCALPISMVDTVMRPEDWQAVYRGTERHLAEGADMVLAVTPHVDDESPVYVSRQAGGFVLAVSDEPIPPPCVTGGGLGVSAPAPPARVDARPGRAPQPRPVP